MAEHLNRLPADDIRLRFGHGSADAIERYLRSIDFRRDAVLGVEDTEGQLLGVAHVPIRDGVAELGVSVLPHVRRRGIGKALSLSAKTLAAGAGARRFSFQFAPSNQAMRKIAERMNMSLRSEGTEVHATSGAGTSES
jgi:GNAT superfamily N-acetyltransferase